MTTSATQIAVCQRYTSQAVAPPANTRIGVALASIGQNPIYGVRFAPEDDMAGWFIWCGEHSDAVDFYQSVHVSHLDELLPLVLPYLALAPGHRFIIDHEGYEDVWLDPDITSG
ncbi:immunity protein Imm33 domain-containing protein [Uliginosibacterium gangwonense]|uniref:immunity protein Imm33 domain-containing protein n=1 Tax=Uliginosibacterium gangwonense TaxID=392736 RepID=UPI0003800CF8|nr:hypothetical protein [Uliginosibacterium gangwonense]